MSALPKSIGWVGLGLMGYPMATNLLKKLDNTTQFYVFDVAKDLVDRFVNDGEGRVYACQSSKEVADKSVCHAFLPSQYTDSGHNASPLSMANSLLRT
jgi:3-hydroxyisobutyrate dehydrogenase